jgi:hypothetical protein
MNEDKTEKRVKVGFTLERKQALLLQVLAKTLGVTQGEVVGYMLAMVKKNTRESLKELKAMVEKDRREAERKLEEMANEL